jgi:hypothetical protein
MTDLSGRLSDFALSQVLTLLGTGAKTGVLRITGSIAEGSLNVNAGKIVHLADDADDLIDILVDLARIPNASFAFESGVVSVGGPDTHHDPADVLPLLAERLAAWAEVEESIGSAYEPFVIVAGADPDAALEVSGAHWNLLASLGDGSSAAGLAKRLGLGEYETAMDLAHFAELGLIAPMAKVSQHRQPPPQGDGTALVEPRLIGTGGAPVREPDTTSTSVVLDLTGPRVDESLAGTDDGAEAPVEAAPASELAARWRDLRASRR